MQSMHDIRPMPRPVAPQLRFPKPKKLVRLSVIVTIALILIGGLAYAHYFGPTNRFGTASEFVVKPGESTADVARALASAGYVRHAWIFRIAQGSTPIRPGGYDLAASEDVWTIASTLAGAPAFAFVTIPAAARKEQIADVLASALAWTPAEKQEWLTKDTVGSPILTDGTYYADEYLIPANTPPAQVAKELRDRFVDVTATYAIEATKKGLSWEKVLTLASLIEREAGKNDKALVAGILWNRLAIGMPLQVDATLQYAKGSEGDWWPQPTSADKFIDSPFNTYQNPGLPPHPIVTPSISSIEAAIDPAPTDCLYYLHDTGHLIHCAPTYAGQQKNVNKYLK